MKKLMRKTYTLFRLILDAILSFNGTKNAHFLSAEETIRQCITRKKSIIRFGDGELNILRGLDVCYQCNHPELMFLLKSVIQEYLKSPEICPYVLCMPGDFLRGNGFKLLKRKAYFLSWPPSRRYFKQHFDLPVTYGDAFLFAIEYRNIYTKIWLNPDISHIIFVNSSEETSNEFKSTVFCQVTFVPIPNENAFSQINGILNEIKRRIKFVKQTETLVLISAGPCGKALAFLLSMQGIRAIDTGHCFRNPLHKIIC